MMLVIHGKERGEVPAAERNFGRVVLEQDCWEKFENFDTACSVKKHPLDGESCWKPIQQDLEFPTACPGHQREIVHLRRLTRVRYPRLQGPRELRIGQQFRIMRSLALLLDCSRPMLIILASRVLLLLLRTLRQEKKNHSPRNASPTSTPTEASIRGICYLRGQQRIDESASVLFNSQCRRITLPLRLLESRHSPWSPRTYQDSISD